jgi:hypothetical protein
VRHGGEHYYLSADSTRGGVRRYLQLVETSRGDPHWSLRDSITGIRDRVAVGRDDEIIEGFEFYRHVPGR